MKSIFGLTLTVLFALALPAHSLPTKPKYDTRPNGGPDMETGGWHINLGITGARGMILPDEPKEMVVTYVFKDSPAYGVLQEGDRILAANGKKFTTPHRFGYGMDIFGYEGPMMDIGAALEESQGPGLKGKLTFTIDRDGSKQEVALQLSTKYGQFSDTYPDNCQKSRVILDELLDYIVDQQKDNGSWNAGRWHLDTFAALAMLSSDESKHQSCARKAAKFFASKMDGEINYNGGYDCWKYGLYGIYLSEYYLKTGEDWVLEPLEVANDWLVRSQFPEHYRDTGKGKGGWGHRPAGRPEGNGYGPICAITGQALAAWALMDQCGLEVNMERYELAHEFMDKGTNNIGYVWYKDGNGGDNKYADMGRTGISAVAHGLDKLGGASYEKLGIKSAKCIGDNPNTFIDTHASPIWGTGWTAIGALVDEDSFREMMDYNKWHWNLSHCHDGTFYYQPNRDSNPQDYHSNSRLSATVMTAAVLSIQNRNLRIFRGGEGGTPARAVSSVSALRPTPAPARAAVAREMRTFKSADGSKTFEGRLRSFDTASGNVTVIHKNGSNIVFPIDLLSKEDQEYVRANATTSAASGAKKSVGKSDGNDA